MTRDAAQRALERLRSDGFDMVQMDDDSNSYDRHLEVGRAGIDEAGETGIFRVWAEVFDDGEHHETGVIAWYDEALTDWEWI